MSFILNEERPLSPRNNSIHHLLNSTPSINIKRRKYDSDDDTHSEDSPQFYDKPSHLDKVSTTPNIKLEGGHHSFKSFVVPSTLQYPMNIQTSSQPHLLQADTIKYPSPRLQTSSPNGIFNPEKANYFPSPYPIFLEDKTSIYNPMIPMNLSQFPQSPLYTSADSLYLQYEQSSPSEIHKMPQKMNGFVLNQPIPNLNRCHLPLTVETNIQTNLIQGDSSVTESSSKSSKFWNPSTSSSSQQLSSTISTSSSLQLKPQKKESKRNKFFYKEVKDILIMHEEIPKTENNQTSFIGFLNEIFFLFDPKLYVGPSNRDGTFEKRVRLHFLETMELNIYQNKNSPRKSAHNDLSNSIWICWGTLLDSFGYPIFRKSVDIYRIPGNQSALFKSNKNLYGWNVASKDQKMDLRDQAIVIKKQIESIFKDKIDVTFSDLQSSVQSLSIRSNHISQSMNTQSNRSYSSSLNDANEFWKRCGFSDNVIHLDSNIQSILCNVLGISLNRDQLCTVFECLGVIDKEGNLERNNFNLILKRYGPLDQLYDRMIQIIKTKSFNNDMDSEQAKEMLNDQCCGSFLTRYSKKSPETFSIAYKDDQGKIIQFYNIKNDHEHHGLDIDGKKFESWTDLLGHFGSLKYPKIHPKSTKMLKLIEEFCVNE